ncbi:hypothetical protein [Botrimarina hoheduenensis]|uniref:Flagellar MS-ring protein n=1 Tax=Botrimarina hoheduenensis TaxID=2528000 RepID=A0A5C5VXL4_9BACT|nr:hypothetical protein [Botrimarina hoheduenensis]TWT43180.1 flagellar MS-ring protein [Botrimarina hoheduenensis]
MDFVNQTIAQLKELFGTMTPGARITAGLLLAVVVVSMGYLFQQSTAGPDAYLFGGEVFSTTEISRMEGAMATAGIKGFSNENNRLRVPQSLREEAIAAIASASELPADVFGEMDEAIDGGSWLDPYEVKRQRMHAAREKQMSRIISKMPWVDRAYVLFNEEKAAGLRGERRVSAAVSVEPAVGQSITPRHVRAITSLVSGSFDIPADKVSVTDLGGDLMASDGVTADDHEQEVYRTKSRLEQQIRNKLVQQLSHIEGVGVQVNAILDETIERTFTLVKPEGQRESLVNNERTETSKQLRGAPGGRPGLEAQGPGRQGPEESLAQQELNETSLENVSSESVIGSSREERVELGPKLKEAWASIRIPRTYVEKVYRQQKQQAGEEPGETISREETKQLEAEIGQSVKLLARGILPQLALGEDDLKQVQIAFVDVLPRPEPTPPGAVSDLFAMVGPYANSIGMAGLAVFSLVMLRSIASSKGSPEPTGSFPPLRLDTGGSASGSSKGSASDDEPADADRPRLKLKRAESLKDDLTDMVGSDPDAAAAILRSWINNAG